MEALSDRVRRSDEKQQTKVARHWSKLKYYESKVPFLLWQSVLRREEVMRRIELAASAVVVEKAAIKPRKRNVTEQTREWECSAAQSIKRVFRP